MARGVRFVLFACVAVSLLPRLPSAGAAVDHSSSGGGGSSLGFVYNSGEADAPVQLEAFVDLTCPDSRDAWFVFTRVADSYAPSKLRLTVHLFPLPYHRNAHIAATSAFVVESLDPARVMQWLTVVFNNQAAVAKADTEKDGAINVLAALGEELGLDEGLLREGLYKSRYSTKAVSSFKYGAKRGVYGTPFYFLNGRFLKDDKPFWHADEWNEVIASALKQGN